MPTKRETVKEAESESGTHKDVKGVPQQHAHMRHEMGKEHTGSHCHEHHRGKGD